MRAPSPDAIRTLWNVRRAFTSWQLPTSILVSLGFLFGIAIWLVDVAVADAEADFVQIESQYVDYAISWEFSEIPLFQLLQGLRSTEQAGHGSARLTVVNDTADASRLPAYIGLFKLEKGLPTLVSREELSESGQVQFDAVVPGDYWILGVPKGGITPLRLPMNMAGHKMESVEYQCTAMFLHER